ncbi:MAG: hypothetical protein RLZ75_441 [Pseudomonadota bacterium]|jgi:hypothetical protein
MNDVTEITILIQRSKTEFNYIILTQSIYVGLNYHDECRNDRRANYRVR